MTFDDVARTVAAVAMVAAVAINWGNPGAMETSCIAVLLVLSAVLNWWARRRASAAGPDFARDDADASADSKMDTGTARAERDGAGRRLTRPGGVILLAVVVALSGCTLSVGANNGPIDLSTNATMNCGPTSKPVQSDGELILENTGGDTVVITRVDLVDADGVELDGAYVTDLALQGDAQEALFGIGLPVPKAGENWLWDERRDAVGAEIEPGGMYSFFTFLTPDASGGSFTATRVTYSSDGARHQIAQTDIAWTFQEEC
ncbi:hypothetical protein [Isoptericola sp. NPDC055881]